MTLGPLSTYVPPGVYTRTVADADVPSLINSLRLPVIVGVGQEELEQDDLELVRGSSSTLDEQIINEDPAVRWVVDATNPSNPVLGATDGTITRLRVRNFPIVDGQGFGRITNDVRSVIVTVDGVPVAVGSVLGSTGDVTLQVPPAAGSVVRVTYYFHRGDTVFTDNVSDQVTVATAKIITPGYEPFNIVTGVNDVFKFTVDGSSESTVVLLNGSATTVSSLKTQIDSAQVPGLTTSVFASNDGSLHLQLNSQVSLSIGTGSVNGVLGLTSGQATSRTSSFKVFQIPMVDGTSGGVTTTDPSKVVAKVNGNQVLVSAVDGTNGIVTLPYAPAPGSDVRITYWSNTWQDTFDYLPNTLVTNVIRAGISPNRSDYIQGQDFVVSNPSPDVSIVHWGCSYSVSSTTTTAGATPFNESQIIPTLVDDKLFLVPCERFTDTSSLPVTVSSTVFLLPEVPTLGNGRDTALGTQTYNSIANSRQDVITNRPDLVTVRVGRTLQDALGRPAAKVLSVDGVNRKVTLRDPVQPDWNIYATFNYNRLTDDTYIFTNRVAGPVGQGQYEVLSSLLAKNLLQIRFTGKGGGLSDVVQFPRGSEQVPDAMHVGGAPVSEVVTVTFGQAPASNAEFTNLGAQPYSFYSSSGTWRMAINGAATLVTNLATASQGYLVSKAFTSPVAIVTGTNDILNLTIDGVDVSVVLTAGSLTAAQIATQINAVIDVTAPFNSVSNNYLATAITVGSASYLALRSYSVPAALPGGFDHQSYVLVRQGTAETSVGFKTFQRADGTPGALNKPATLLGTNAGPFVVTAGLNDILKVRINGVDFQVTLNSASSTAAQIIADINTVISSQGTASVGTLANLNKVRITSLVSSTQSSIVILNGSANSLLGFNEGDLTSQTQVTAQEVVDRLMATPNFAVTSWGTAGSPGTAPTVNTLGAVANTTTVNGQTFLSITSLVTGVSSSITFVDGSSSAFNIQTGTQITPGVSGDNGEAATDKFTVTSTNPLGSSGTGTPGQTYTDARTGLRFSVLPAKDGSYASGGFFTFEISQTFNVNPGIPYYAIPGLETIVTNTVKVGVLDTANVQTFNPSGVAPKNGDFYFISYRFLKQDYSTKIYRQFKTIEANYGPISAENRVTLAAYLAITNGAVLVAVKQVKKVVNTNQASAQSFIDAISVLATPLPGNIRPDLVTPLSTDTSVYSYLTQHCEVMSNERNASERMGFLGFASGTTPSSVQTIVKALFSSRIVAFYPDSAVITLTDELGQNYESLVDGSFFAAAFSGSACSPAVDVATPYTRRRVQGFTRIPRILDPVEANQTAVAGVTIMEDLNTVVRVRQGLTTNMTSVLTRLPTVTQIDDFVHEGSRSVLDAFIGTKFLTSRSNEVETSMTGLFRQLTQQEITAAYTGISAVVDSSDPTVMDAEAFYQPIFPLLYINLRFSLRAKL